MDIIKRNLKDRYIYILILFVALIFLGFCNKSIKYDEKNVQEDKLFIENQVVIQEINIEKKNPSEIQIKVGKNNPHKGAKYEFSVRNEKNELINTVEFNSLNIGEEQFIGISIAGIDSKRLKLEIEGDAQSAQDGIYLYTYSENINSNITIDGEEENISLKYRVGYAQYSKTIILSTILLLISGSIFILLLDVKKIHNYVFGMVLLCGIFTTLLNPILDTPDDHAHLCRSELTSRGILFINGDTSNYKISNSVGKIIDNNYLSLRNSEIYNDKMDFSYESSYANYANTNLFIGYIPQALGILFAKTLGAIFGLSSMFIVIFGRLFNLLFYATILRYAIKIAPIFKIPLCIAGISPMALFIAASFNPDTTTYGLVFLLIGYVLHLYKKEDIVIKDIIIYAILCILIGLVKLPYCIIGGLIIFLPKEKFKSKKIYYYSFIFVLLIAIVSIAWGGIAMLNSSSSSPFDNYYIDQNINAVEQVNNIISAPIRFIKNFLLALLSNLKIYVDQFNTFGWLSYGLNGGVMILYTIFIGSVILLYPNEEVICKKTKIGISLVAFGIYAATGFILYLTWTPVGDVGISGVQGRYFVPLIGLIMLLSGGKLLGKEKEKKDIGYLIGAMIFMLIFIVTIMTRYY